VHFDGFAGHILLDPFLLEADIAKKVFCCGMM
jgi:hypothetical protein